MKRLTMVQWLIETTYLWLQINILHCEKKLAYPPTASGYYGRQEGWESGRQAGRQADKIWVGFKFFQIL